MWRTVGVVFLVVIVISTVFAAANSFDARGMGPASYSASVVIATPTPEPRMLHHTIGLDAGQIREQAWVIVEAPLPEDFVVPIAQVLAKPPESFHLCLGERPCGSGVFAHGSTYHDGDGDELADQVFLRFEAPQVESLLPQAAREEAGETGGPMGRESNRTTPQLLPFTVSGTIWGWPTDIEWPHLSTTAHPPH